MSEQPRPRPSGSDVSASAGGAVTHPHAACQLHLAVLTEYSRQLHHENEVLRQELAVTLEQLRPDALRGNVLALQCLQMGCTLLHDTQQLLDAWRIVDPLAQEPEHRVPSPATPSRSPAVAYQGENSHVAGLSPSLLQLPLSDSITGLTQQSLACHDIPRVHRANAQPACPIVPSADSCAGMVQLDEDASEAVGFWLEGFVPSLPGMSLGVVDVDEGSTPAVSEESTSSHT